MISDMKKLLVSAGLLLMTGTAMATKLVGLHVLDKDYLMIQFRDGEVHYRDSGTGKSAYLGHSFAEGDDTLFVFGERLNTEKAQKSDTILHRRTKLPTSISGWATEVHATIVHGRDVPSISIR